MNYIENVFFCLSAPLLVSVFVVHKYRRRSILFIFTGMVACLFSSYISTFLAKVLDASALDASLEISPLIEESLKLLPLVFYIMVYEPRNNEAAGEALMVGVGFATLENACYLINNGAESALDLVIRGFGTGAMHVVCGAITAVVLRGLWESLYFRFIATLGVLCVAITFHGIFNVLVNQQGIAAWIGCFLPLILGAATVVTRRKLYGDAMDPIPGPLPGK